MVTKEEFEKRNKMFEDGLKLAYEEMIRFKRAKNSPIVMMENGEIVHKDPFSVPLPEDLQEERDSV